MSVKTNIVGAAVRVQSVPDLLCALREQLAQPAPPRHPAREQLQRYHERRDLWGVNWGMNGREQLQRTTISYSYTTIQLYSTLLYSTRLLN